MTKRRVPTGTGKSASRREAGERPGMSEYAYYYALFPPEPTSEWVRFKRMSIGFNVARRLWKQREEFRRRYEAQHGTDRRRWPERHPGVVLDAVDHVAHPACLGCAWLDPEGVYMKLPDWRERASAIALDHERGTR